MEETFEEPILELERRIETLSGIGDDPDVVTDAALLSDQQGRYAMVVNEQNEVEVRRVEVGMLDGTMRVVKSGLEPDDRVIVLGVLKARPGSKVTPKTESESQAAR